MRLRNVTAALLSILLLLGSLSQGHAGVTSGSTTHTTNSMIHCNGMNHASAIDAETRDAKIPMNCSSPKNMSCLRIAAQCAFMPLHGIVAVNSVPPFQRTALSHTALTIAVYQSPIADVLTPPPDTLF